MNLFGLLGLCSEVNSPSVVRLQVIANNKILWWRVRNKERAGRTLLKCDFLMRNEIRDKGAVPITLGTFSLYLTNLPASQSHINCGFLKCIDKS